MEQLFFQAISILKEKHKDPSFSQEQKGLLLEAITRLKSVFEAYSPIIDLNDELLRNNEELVIIRDLMSEENLSKMLQGAATKDGRIASWLAHNRGIVKKESSSEIAAFNMHDLNESQKINKQIKKLHAMTENAYHNLWAIKEKLVKIPAYKKFDPVGIRNVRNQLIEHVDKFGAHIFSFGISTNGPVIRPIKPAGAQAANDLGFPHNIKEFLEKLIEKGTAGK